MITKLDPKPDMVNLGFSFFIFCNSIVVSFLRKHLINTTIIGLEYSLYVVRLKLLPQ